MPKKREVIKTIPTVCLICGNLVSDNDGDEHQHICPICLKAPAISPHLLKPAVLNGTNDRRNILYLCQNCHNTAEAFCTLRKEILSPALISGLRFGLTSKRDEDCEIFQKTLCGKTFIMWIHPKGGSRHLINQFIDGVPDEYIHPEEQEEKPAVSLPIVYGREKGHGKRGRPVNSEITTEYLLQLINSNNGMSLRQVRKYLITQNYNVSVEFIRKRIKKIIKPEELVECPKCHTQFKPKDRRNVFCSPACYIATYRKPGKKIITEVPDAIIPAAS